MLKFALLFELRSLVRSRVGLIALLAFLGTGAIAIATGVSHVNAWNEALESAQAAERASIEEAHAFFEAGQKGPEDKPWVDLSKPRWQDDYSGARVLRQPGPLALIAAGSIDPAPVAFHLRPWGDPLADAGYRIENPEVSAGAIDLVFVLTILAPLLLGVLGLDIGGREREDRIDRLLIVQAGQMSGWLLGRVIAVTGIVAAAAAIICLSAGFIGGAPFAQTAALTGLAIAYVALWGGLLLGVSASAKTVRAGAFAFGTLWTLLCVLSPAIIAEMGLGRLQADFSVDQTLDARESQYAGYDKEESERVAMLYSRFPELKDLPAAAEEPLDPSLRRHTYQGPQLDGLTTRYEARRVQDADAAAFVTTSAWLSPPVAFTVALERIAGVGADAASGYRDYLFRSLVERTRWIMVQAWTMKPLDISTFDALVASAPAPFQAKVSGLTPPLMAILVWLFVGWGVSYRQLRRSDT